ncbi:MAG: hypothetical protein GX621_09325 [Pirellulaceae bacterium]|nr:hypothetical protein [Pirellulaceae bacterium]
MEDERAISEITIAPDGRIFVFGMSKELLEVLETLSSDDDGMKQRVDLMRRIQRNETELDARGPNPSYPTDPTVSGPRETNHD